MPSKKATELTKTTTRTLAKSQKAFTVGSLEEALLKKFPAQNAEDWDITGITVGERAMPVKRIAVALDPTVATIRDAAALGADVLVTHHPPYLSGPTSFAPADSVAENPGAGVWAAIQNRVSLMNFHTACDVSKPAQNALSKMLGFKATGKLLLPITENKALGYGAICQVVAPSKPAETLRNVAAKCVSVFGKTSQVWGDFDKPVRTCATILGSANSTAELALKQGIDCIICGELGYHKALDLADAGLGIIVLGHDVSERPLIAVLAQAISEVGFPLDEIVVIDKADNWSHPEAIRL